MVAYNLVTLRDRLAGFRTLQGRRVRRPHGQAARPTSTASACWRSCGGHGRRCARSTGSRSREPVIVEIFPAAQGIRRADLRSAGADGFLGVCFGRVITANSPASQGEHPSNWEAVLWHEFCHVVTLSKTHNKMPRWLSEGISVYEEGREDPAWATALNPQFRAMILGDELTPLSQLSSAFLAPKTPLHLQFAYFESALAVDFLVERFGLPALKGVLDDLGAGMSINEALPRRTKMSLEQIDAEFAQFARQRAEKVAPDATWEEPDLPADADSAAIDGLAREASQEFRGSGGAWRRGWWSRRSGTKAKEVLEKLKALYPEYVGAENAYLLLAVVYRRLSDPAAEHKVLEELAMRDGDASPAYLRLMELDEAAGDWRGVAQECAAAPGGQSA